MPMVAVEPDREMVGALGRVHVGAGVPSTNPGSKRQGAAASHFNSRWDIPHGSIDRLQFPPGRELTRPHWG